jgi:Family of unknown function (DUF6264)
MPRPMPRPLPEYGEYATPEEQAAAIGTVPEAIQDITPQAVVAPEPVVVSPRRRWDIIATVALLIFGAYATFSSIPQFANLQGTIEEVYAAYGYTGTYPDPGLASAIGITVNIVQPIALVLAMFFSARRLRAGKVSFWIPLGSGIIVTIVASALLITAFYSDPAFLAFLAKAMGGS